MSENTFYDSIIVGGGPGGLAAGMYAMRAALKTVCIEKGERCLLRNGRGSLCRFGIKQDG